MRSTSDAPSIGAHVIAIFGTAILGTAIAAAQTAVKPRHSDRDAPADESRTPGQSRRAADAEREPDRARGGRARRPSAVLREDRSSEKREANGRRGLGVTFEAADDRSVRVASVEENSAAARSGLR